MFGQWEPFQYLVPVSLRYVPIIFLSTSLLSFLKIFIYLAASGLSCSTRDLRCGMRDLFVVARELFTAACGLLSRCGV